MRNLTILLLVLMVNLTAASQSTLPDLKNTGDLKLLGLGRLIEKDNDIIKNITLQEVKEFWIIYVKNESLHDMVMENIDRIEFPESKWGPLYMEFPGNKPVIYELSN